MAKKKLSVKNVDTLDAEKKILLAYVRLCYQIGAVNVTIQKIADEAGVAFGTVRYYFSSEDKLIHDEAFVFLFTHSYQVIDDILFELRAKPRFDPMAAYVETMFRWIREFPEEGSLLMYLYYLSSTGAELRVRAKTVVDRARLRVESLLHEAVGQGLYRPVRDVKECAAAIQAVSLGFGFIALTVHHREQFQLQQELCWQAVKSLLRAHETAEHQMK